jgi:hypothetical protein
MKPHDSCYSADLIHFFPKLEKPPDQRK